jgi:hypothetical protein
MSAPLIKPHRQQQAETSRREAQTRLFRRNQVLGLVLVAALIWVFWLLRAPHGWAFPRGWWRM